jgi:hypothetical protein
MDKQKTNRNGMNPQMAQLKFVRLALLFIPLYLFTLSPTCGVFGAYLHRIDFVLRMAFALAIPGLIFSFLGVVGNSNAAIGISGAALTIIAVVNTAVPLYLTIFDFTLLLFFLEISTTLTSFSEIVKSIEPGEDENISYNYRVVLSTYVRRLLVALLITLLASLGALFIAVTVVVEVGTSAIASLSILTLLLVFVVFARRYGEGPDH